MAEGKRFDIVSVGDCVMDCLFYVNRMPIMGETMASNNFACLPGGKGANACVASARLGSKNAMICKLGNDLFGQNFIDILARDDICTKGISFTDKVPTSVASILVDNQGNNYITVNFGATLELDENDLNNVEEIIKYSKILVTSMVVKKETAIHALKLAKKHDLITVFNFAPAVEDCHKEFSSLVDILIVNEVEAEAFTESKVNTVQDAKDACALILSKNGFHVGVVVTLGDKGVVFGNRKTGQIYYIPAKKVNVVDTTGAGDAFVGSLAHYVCKLGLESVNKAVELACQYASLTVESKGTQSSYPHWRSLDKKFFL